MLVMAMRVGMMLILGRLSLGPKRKRHLLIEGRRCSARDIGLPLLMNATDADKYGLSSASARRLVGCGHLDLALSPLGEEGAVALAGAMSRSSARWRDTLRHVNLTCTAIGTVGADKLLESLKDSRVLESLDLSGNWLGDSLIRSSNFIALASGRRAKASLRSLRLRWNSLSDASGDALSQILSTSANLTELDVGGNLLHTLGVQMLASGLRGHPGLQHLRLDHNGIDSRGVLEVSSALTSNKTALVKLDLGGNEIDDDGAIEIARLLEAAKPSRLQVNLRLNEHITMVGASRLARALRQSGPLPHALGRRAVANSSAMNRAERAAAHVEAMRHYWEQVYPFAAPASIDELVSSRGTMAHRHSTMLVYRTAPKALSSPQPCHRLRVCPAALQNATVDHERPVKVSTDVRASHFAPVGLLPGACMRNRFGRGPSRSAIESAYPRMAGAEDNSWTEVTQLHNQSGFMRMYLATGSGVFWNCGTSLRARNKVAAAMRLTEQLAPVMSRDLAKGTPAETLAHAITSNDASACSVGSVCKDFLRALGPSRTSNAALATWLTRVAHGTEPPSFEGEQLSALPVFDQILLDWGKRVGYDSIQLAMQSQPSCGLWWTTELFDLRVRRYHATDVLPFLSVRDPLAASDTPGAVCQLPKDRGSRRAFNVGVFCEGTLMERSVRCFADAMRGRHGRLLARHRIEDCVKVS